MKSHALRRWRLAHILTCGCIVIGACRQEPLHAKLTRSLRSEPWSLWLDSTFTCALRDTSMRCVGDAIDHAPEQIETDHPVSSELELALSIRSSSTRNISGFVHDRGLPQPSWNHLNQWMTRWGYSPSRPMRLAQQPTQFGRCYCDGGLCRCGVGRLLSPASVRVDAREPFQAVRLWNDRLCGLVAGHVECRVIQCDTDRCRTTHVDSTCSPAERVRSFDTSLRELCVATERHDLRCWNFANGACVEVSVGRGHSDIEHIVSSTTHHCAQRQSGTVDCWAEGSRPDVVETTLPASAGSLVDLFAASHHHCARTRRADVDDVYCWGEGSLGRTGQPTDDLLIPRRVSLPRPAVAVAVGALHSCAQLDDGTSWCWGANFAGQTARVDARIAAMGILNRLTSEPAPREVRLPEGSELSVRDAATCGCYRGNCTCLGNAEAIRSSRYGTNAAAQASNECSRWSERWTLAGLVPAQQSCSSRHSCALDRRGDVFCVGANDWFQSASPASTFRQPIRAMTLTRK